MTHEEFVKKVKQMREMQQKYFRTRDSSVLRDCKQLERQVDIEITHAEAEFSDKKQPKLF